MTWNSHPVPPPPSWPRVIATTLRLWVQRRVVPGWRRPSPVGSGVPERWPRRFAGGFLVISVVGGVFSAFAITSDSAAPFSAYENGAPRATPHRASPPTVRTIAAAATSRQQAAAWVETQVSRGVVVGCDPLMCAALLQHRFPPADLAVLGPSAGDPLGSGVVMSTAAVRSDLGPDLANVYAPAIIASFGTGASLVQVRIVTPGGAAAYRPAEQADFHARQIAGRELADNKNILEPGPARAALVAGRVDSRLLITLAALAAASHIEILSFSDAGPGMGASAPLRQLTFTSSSAGDLRQLLAFLNAQRPPLRAIVSQHRAGRTTAVQIRFTAPNPTGLLTFSAPSTLAATGRKGHA